MSHSSSHQHQPAVRPEDVLPEGVDSTAINGMTVRKGSVAAFVANALRLDELTEGTPEYAALVAQMRELAPALRAIGLNDVFRPHSPAVERILAEAA
ncbi:hypothetical protein [Streptomyces violascens]|uniref:Uncharacterized protein n=1 Tax=Streptomyces violascens TaxID=67381 RepID=A0ABQ3QSP2_9ACTN|nr:hypothetical protein [Streptomyces violascens]GGU33319.1 hypothetical protein GCM10010289_63220 [Streptomyces violascens]GHI40263.1 hypothetical protein Sviol_46710 [Streptomyces violascens]